MQKLWYTDKIELYDYYLGRRAKGTETANLWRWLVPFLVWQKGGDGYAQFGCPSALRQVPRDKDYELAASFLRKKEVARMAEKFKFSIDIKPRYGDEFRASGVVYDLTYFTGPGKRRLRILAI